MRFKVKYVDFSNYWYTELVGYRVKFSEVDASAIKGRTSSRNLNTNRQKWKTSVNTFSRQIRLSIPYFLKASFCKPGFPRKSVQDSSRQLVCHVYREQ